MVMGLNFDKLDFEHCADEPIHTPESIQAYGYLFAVDPESHRIKIYSENVRYLVTEPIEVNHSVFFDLVDQNSTDIQFILDSYRWAKEQQTRLPVELKLNMDLINQGEQIDFHAVVYSSQDMMIVELEPDTRFFGATSVKQYSKIYSMNILPRFRSIESVEEMAESIVETVRKLTGFERVVLYKFNADQSGKVIAESKVDDLESYLNLYYPASDIPAQARELYKKNWIRLTPNVDLDPVPLLPKAARSQRKHLDLTQSLLRTMSPIHLQYVRNQGLKSSMSISLVTHSDLWGLISCHHRDAHYIPQDIRLDCENLSQLFSWHLYAKEEEIARNKKGKIDRTVSKLLEQLSDRKPIWQIFKENEDEILNLMDAKGFVFKISDREVYLGETPSPKTLSTIVDHVFNTKKPVWASHRLQHLFESADLGELGGALFVPLARNKKFFTAWFRDVKSQCQRWAGNPNEKRMDAEKAERLKPRASFKVHEVLVDDESIKWSENDIEVAEKFHKLFLTHALDLSDKMQSNISILEEKDQTKDEFLATLAHELRNPLAPMATAVELLEDESDVEMIRAARGSIQRQLSQMGRLVDDLLDVSKITKRQIRINLQEVNLVDVINHAVELSQSTITLKNHQLNLDLPDGTTVIRGDFNRLAQVFGNLLNNAAKYTDPNGKISVRTVKDGDFITVVCEDNGIGIPKEKISEVFDMFMQVDTTENTRGGLGIGLTIAKRIVDLHGGKIEVKSGEGFEGTKFYVSLPLCPQLPEQPIIDSPSQIEGGHSKVDLLLVDDVRDITEMLRLFLERQGYSVRTASTGEQAIQLFKERVPDIAILDIGLPDISGFDLCRRLKGLDSHTAFFAQSGWGKTEDIHRSQELGFIRHFVKPVKPSRIVEAVEDYIRGRSDGEEGSSLT